MPTYNNTFTVDLGYANINNAVSLSPTDEIEVRFVMKNASTANWTASISSGEFKASSLAASTGYSSVTCPYFDTGSMSSSLDEIILSVDLSTFYKANNYLFVPNPLTGSQNTLYDIYGDVDYKLQLKPYDIVVVYLTDGTYLEYRVISIDSTNTVRIKLDSSLSQQIKNDIISGSYQRMLLLTRIDDETNAYITYRKRPGPTSYGLAIPSNIHPDVLANIDTITREAKQKLIELGGIDGGSL